jgi:hypothetical protein
MLFGPVLLLLLLVLLHGNVLIWRRHSVCCFLPGQVVPGMKYVVEQREYAVPNLAMKGSSHMLHPVFIAQQRSLLGKLFHVCRAENTEVWASGGTLLGYVRHGTTMPWDDDCDVHTSIDNLAFMGSSAFQTALQRAGLERVKVIGTSVQRAPSRLSGALRVRHVGTLMPTCDIFFVKCEEGLVKKIDRWHGHQYVYNQTERWAEASIFPIKAQRHDNMLIPMPHKPTDVLTQQYGPKVLHEMHVRTTWLAHGYPLQFFSKALVTDDL